MSNLSLSLRGTKEELLPKLSEAIRVAKEEGSVLMFDIINALVNHVESVKDEEVVTFSIRGNLVVQHLKRNHQVY